MNNNDDNNNKYDKHVNGSDNNNVNNDELSKELYEMTHGSSFIIPLVFASIICTVFIIGFIIIAIS